MKTANQIQNNEPWLFEDLGRISENESYADIQRFTLEKLRFPKSKDMIKICAIVTDTTKVDVDGLDKILSQTINDIDANIIITPEYYYSKKNDKPLTEKQKDFFLKKKKKETAKCKEKLIIPGSFLWHKNGNLYNTAYLLFNGEIIGEYNKICDGREKNIADENKLIWKYGKKIGLFEWEGLKLGIELCVDSGSLKCQGITNLDLLLHVCCGFGIGSLTTSINSIKFGGYYLQIDGFKH